MASSTSDPTGRARSNPLTRLVTALHSGDASPREALERYSQRLARTEPIVKAFSYVDLDSARAVAHGLERVPASRRHELSLYGAPLAVKDLIDVAGMPTRGGSRLLSPTPARSDAPPVTALRRAGAVIVGKVTTHELGLGVRTPPTRNPWDPARIAGGSSGGSAAATAAGSVAGALGTDTAGSVRVPASLCGVWGMRPRPGQLQMNRTIALAPGLDTIGPIAAGADDLARLWAALTGRPVASPPPIKRLRVGVVTNEALGELEPAVLAEVDAALTVLARAGARLIEVALDLVQPVRAGAVVMLASAHHLHSAAGWFPDRVHEYSAGARAAIEFGSRVNTTCLEAARAELAHIATTWRRTLRGLDVLALPTTPRTAPTAEQGQEHEGALTAELTRYCAPVSFAGLAAVSVPCGLTQSGLPVGLQLVAADELRAIGIARLVADLLDGDLRPMRRAASGA
jgi:aspartyl-tRNA(Asn)/glutamyl-tRNA(Gln) amidotransferase subunit A